MGGPGSGRIATKSRIEDPVRSQTLKVRHAAPVAWSNVKALLASTRSNLAENPDYVPPSSVLNLHQWVIEQDEGKATARIEANIKAESTLILDPSRALAMLRERELIEAEYALLPDVMSHNNDCASTPSCVVPDYEEGWVGEDPVRIVSSPPEKIVLYPSEADITYSEGGGI